MKIDLKGIQSNISHLNTNGTAQDIIGLRNKYGEWTQIPAAKEILYLGNNTTGESYYIHPINKADQYSNDKYYWGYDSDSNVIFRYDSFGGDYTEVITLGSSEEFYSFIHFGNVFIVNTSLGVYRYIFNEGVYEKLEELPRLSFSVGTADRSHIFKEEVSAGSDWFNAGYAKIMERIAELTGDGKVQGHTLFVLAFETVTGEYINPTPIVYNYLGSILSSENTYIPSSSEATLFYVPESEYGGSPPAEWGVDNTMFGSMLSYIKYKEGDTNAQCFVGGKYVKPEIKIQLSASEVSVLGKYEGLITGVSVFMTKPISDINYDKNNYTKHGLTETHFSMFMDSALKVDDIIKDNISFYKLGEFILEDLTTGENSKVFKVESLETKEVLSATQSHDISAKVTLDYNDRIHLANVLVKLSDTGQISIDDDEDNYAQDDVASPSQGKYPPLYPVYAAVKMKVNNEIKIIITPYSELASSSVVNIGGTDYGNEYILSPVVSYPDTRAFEMDIYQVRESGAQRLVETIRLTPHTSLNMAVGTIGSLHAFSLSTYYPPLYDYDDGLYVDTINASGINFRIFKNIVIDPSSAISAPSDTTDNRYYQDKNRMQLSANSDPLSYPAVNSYRVGRLEQEIKSIAVNTLQLSEGQYGEHPLFIFSESGVWAMVKGSDSLVYSSVIPVSTDVIINNKAVPTKAGIAFLAEKGLVLQSGSQALVLSQALDGQFKNPVLLLDHFKNALDGSLDTGELYEYLTGNNNPDWTQAAIGYDYVNDELYVSFPIDYTFVFNMNTKLWYKRKESWSEFMYHEGHLLGVNDKQFTDINQLSSSTASNDEFVYVSNPISLDNTELKKYYNVRLPYSGTNLGNKYSLGVYVFGSNNLQEWKLIHGKRFKQTKLIELKKVRASAKYHIFVIVGNQYHPVFKDIDIEFI